MKRIQQVISLLLTVVIISNNVLPTVVSATEVEPTQCVTEAVDETVVPVETAMEGSDETTPTIKVYSESDNELVSSDTVTETTSSGSCGDNLTWTLQDNILTISGTGPMTDYEQNGAPWQDGAFFIQTINLPDGLTSIGNYAFKSTGVRYINIPESVQSIGKGAFSNCQLLSQIAIPEGITEIEDYTFSDCRYLRMMYRPDEESLENYYNQRIVSIPSSVTSIGASAFYNCSQIGQLNLPEALTTVGDSAFSYCSGLTGVVIPESVTELGEYVFDNCTGLTNVTFPEKIAILPQGTFSYCSSLAEIEIPATITVIDSAAFRGCSALKNVVIPYGVTSVSSSCFAECTSLSSVTIPDTVTSIGSSAFSECTSLTNITIPNSVNSIGMSAFSDCTYLTNVTIPGSVSTMDAYVFSGCTGLTSAILTEGISELTWYTFFDCSALKEIYIPETITSIGIYAFYNCTALTDVYYGGTEEQWVALLKTTSSAINAPLFSDTLTVHYNGTGEPVTPEEPVDNTCGENLTWTLENGVLTITGTGAMTDYTMYGAPWYESWANITQIHLPEGLTSIGDHAFAFCNVFSLSIPSTVTSIGDNAFYCCAALKSIEIPYGVTAIGDSAFWGCNAATSLSLTETITQYGNSAFGGCMSFSSVRIPGGGSAAISNAMFAGCANLHTVTIADGVPAIGSSAFANCTALANVSIPDSVVSIGEMVFQNCQTLSTITLPDSLTTIPMQLFCQCSSLEQITIPAGVESIGSSAFAHSGITSIIIPDSVTQLGSYMFDDCAKLKAVTLPAGITSIPNSAFYACVALLDIYFAGTEEQWAVLLENADEASNAPLFSETLLVHCNWTGEPEEQPPLPDAIIAEGKCGPTATWKLSETGTLTISGTGMVTEAPWREDYLDQINKVIVEDGITVLRYEAFTNCTSLKRVSLPTSLTGIGAHAFANCTSLTDVFIMSYSLTIDENVFLGCANINNVFYFASKEYLSEDIHGYQQLGHSDFTYYDWSPDEVNGGSILASYNGEQYNLADQTVNIARMSEKTVTISAIAGMSEKYDGIAQYALEQTGKTIMHSTSGTFSQLNVADNFVKNEPVYVAYLDSKGEEICSEKLNITVVDSYTITYVIWNEDSIELDLKSYIDGASIVEPDVPERDGYIFCGWYTSNNYDGYSFFHELNSENRKKTIGNLTLYAKWEENIPGSLVLGVDTWQFTNNRENFTETQGNITYEMYDPDYNILVKNITSGEKSDIDDLKNTSWFGACFGLSSVVVLDKGGYISIDNYFLKDNYETYDNIGDIPNAHKLFTKSMIHFYHLRQYLDPIEAIWTDCDEYELGDSNNLRNIMIIMQVAKKPVMLDIAFLKADRSNMGRHAVVAYDLVETETEYQFKIYDCAFGSEKYYPVSVDKTTFATKCDNWETDWRMQLTSQGKDRLDHIFFKKALTAEDLVQCPILPTNGGIYQYRMLAKSDVFYYLRSECKEFTISDGKHAATIKNGRFISGDLNITCCGAVNEFLENENFLYKIPALSADCSYTITYADPGSARTIIKSDDIETGFYTRVDTSGKGSITISADGSITTQFEEETNQDIRVTRNDMETPWYIVDISGTSTGLTVTPSAKTVSIISETDTTVDVTTKSSGNSLSLMDISAGTNAVLIQEDKNEECVVVQGDEIVAGNNFGFSVLFNSGAGTVIPALTNITSGSQISVPEDPTRSGYIFEGWFKDEACTDSWDFATDTVTEDLVLYAGWSVDPNYMKSVTFRLSGMDDQIVYMPVNSLIPADYAPTATDGENILWFADRACTELWNFETDTLTGNLILYGQAANRITLEAADLTEQTAVWIDGVEYFVQEDGNKYYVDLPDGNAKTMTVYTYNMDEFSDIQTQYPISMKVWTLNNENGCYTATREEALDNILQYSGMSIRVTGKKGIRMITSIEKDKKDSLISAGLAGYTLKEYGTVVAWAEKLDGDNPLVLNQSYTMSNYAYRKGIADPVFAYDGNLMQYTNVLVNFSDEQCKKELALRSYMILEDGQGETITIYGGIVTRSIGYIAYQNRNTFSAGTEAYHYIWNIIRTVYGNTYDAEYVN